MNKLTESEQRQLDMLVNDNDHYRRGITDYRLLQAVSESQILQLLKKRDAYTSDKRRIYFDGDIVKIEKHPRKSYCNALQ